MTDQWQELKDTIIEIRDNNEFEHGDVTLMCRFLVNYMEVLEKQMQEPCEDAISRQAALNALYALCDTGETLKENPWRDNPHIDAVVETIEELPSVNSQQKMGEWIRWYEQKETEWYTECIPHCKCSECGKEYDPHSSQFIKYCNECGAKMQEVEE